MRQRIDITMRLRHGSCEDYSNSIPVALDYNRAMMMMMNQIFIPREARDSR